MTLAGTIGLACALALLWMRFLTRKRPVRGGLLIRRLSRVSVRLHNAAMTLTALTLLALLLPFEAHRAFGVLSLSVLGAICLIRWRALLGHGGERRFTAGMRLWIVALIVGILGHVGSGWSGWVAIALLAGHGLHLWAQRRILADGMMPLETARARWPAWLRAVQGEAEGRRIRRFGARFRPPPF